MKTEELEYFKRAVDALQSGDHSSMSQIKILRVVKEICEKNIRLREQEIEDQINLKLDRTYQDLQNFQLMELLKRNR